ncbi:related to Protein transport protein SEC31 [Cephalotrichum gorgonifer]|uniref:Protein transport protein SEC31 n=1 Tax=Cephalotrichum gorgonifer TaxID=2041049 RepID=A0AAE8SZ71_9PEZI|nr:related to Protein transport protein SEC31 [Cephalotrichum gorgonifer]
MVRLREIPRTATFAWSPGTSKPLLVTGTRAGAVADDFSDETRLELWDLDLDNHDQGLELQPVASISTDSSFYDIAWGPPDDDHPKGIIAGALENGSLDLWDAEKLAAGAPDALISRTTKHTGPAKAVQFNPLKTNIVATAGAKGEIFVYDVNDPESAFRLGTAAARADDIECLAWNKKVSHILATGGSGGFVTVWDLKTKKPSLTLNNNRKAVSAIAWDPNNSTKLLTSTPDDSAPAIILWDLRNASVPERTLEGHVQGVLSLSWCQHDSDLLLSCGKDNKTIVWNPQTGERYGEFPEVTNWTFLTQFNPHNPNLTATASFDGKIIIHTLQNTNPSSTKADAQSSLDDEAFFSNAQTQPQDTFFSLPQAPRWAERPVGACFGFGGKLVVFTKGPVTGGKRTSKLVITQFSVDTEVGTASEKFEESLKSGDVAAICASRIADAATDEDKADWRAMETLASQDARQKIIEQLGLKDAKAVNGTTSQDTEEVTGSKDEKESGDGGKSGLFSDDAAEEDGGDDDFFSKGPQEAQGGGSFQLLGDEDTEVDKEITKAIMLGNFAKATDICLKEDRMADAFLIANCGGQELVDKVQSAYLASKKSSPSYVRLLGSVITKDLWDVVNNAGLDNWKEIMAVLCTFSSPEEFSSLCEALGDRIESQGARKDASFCYLVGSKLEKVVPIWISALEEAEKSRLSEAQDGSSFSIHAKTLQDFIEKVTVFRQVSKFQDSETGLTSGWKLAPLYNKYIEYADIVASHGQLATAQKYLDLLPAEYPAAEIARNRVRLATKKGAPQPAAKQTTGRAPSRIQPAFGYQPPQPAQASNPMVPSPAAHPAPAANPYAPPANQPYGAPANQPYGAPVTTSPYAPTSAYQPPGSQPNFLSTPGYGPPPTTFGAPARSATPTRPPPSQDKNTENWNDIPFVTKKAPPRRSTPSVAPVTSPFQGATPPPPPPKASGPPRVSSPLTGPPQSFQHQGPPRPSSTAASAYAPPPPQAGGVPPQAQQTVQQAIPRVGSPYSAPPSGPPPSSRYAPAPAPPAQPPVNQPRGAMPPPPNPYGAPPPQQGPPKGPYAPPSYGATPEQSRPPRLVDILSRDVQRVASRAPANFAPQVKDTQKRLELLFDHLNNGELIQPDTIEKLSELADAIESKDYDTATSIQVSIQTTKTEECGKWMPGVKRLIVMSRNIPA